MGLCIHRRCQRCGDNYPTRTWGHLSDCLSCNEIARRAMHAHCSLPGTATDWGESDQYDENYCDPDGFRRLEHHSSPGWKGRTYRQVLKSGMTS